MNSNKQLILMALQTAKGVPVAPSAPLHALRAYNINFNGMSVEEKELEYAKEDWGSNKSKIVRVNSTISFNMYLAGSGTPGTPPPWGIPMQACAHAETIDQDTKVTYSTVSNAYLYATIYFWRGGEILHKMSDVLGTFTENITAGDFPYFTFDMQGKFEEPEDGDAPDNIDWSRYHDPDSAIPINTGTINVFGRGTEDPEPKPMRVQSFTLAGNRTIVRPPWAKYDETVISDATPDGTMAVYAEKLTAMNFWDRALKGTEGPLSYTHGVLPGQIIRTTINKASVSSPNYGENEGMLTNTFNYKALRDPANGDYTIECE